MAVNIPSHFAQQFATNIQLLLQQKGSRLRNCVMSGPHVGEQASPVDQVGAISMLPVTERFAPMGRVDTPLDRRWVQPLDYDLPQLIDSFDKLRLLIDPTSSYVQNAVLAAGRQYDASILGAFDGTNYTGKSGTTPIVFPSSQKVAVTFGSSGNSSLSVAKLREAKRILMKNDVDLDADELYAPIDATQHDALLGEAQVISTDYNDAPVMKEGKITRFLGINLIHTELVEKVGSNSLIPVWAKSGMYLGIWGDIATSVSQRHDLRGEPFQAYVKMTMGATRLEEKKCVQITCVS